MSNPCPEYTDLNKDFQERTVEMTAEEQFDYYKPAVEMDRQTCLVEWVKRYQDLAIWE